jgi:hypothetical protein
MKYWKGYPQTNYVDELWIQIKYTKGEMELGYFSHRDLYHYFNGFMLLAVM